MLSHTRSILQKTRAANMRPLVNTRQSVILCIFAIGIIVLSLRYSKTGSLERPVVLSAFTLLWTGLGLALYTRWKTGEAIAATKYVRQIAASRTRDDLLRLLAVPVALVARAFVFRHTLWWTQCTTQGIFTFLPALLVVADWVWPQHDYTPLAGYERSPSPPQGIWSHLGKITEKQRAARPRFPARHAGLAASWAVLANRMLALTARTTGAVCPAGTLLWPAAGLAQLLVLGFDAVALFALGRRSSRKRYHHHQVEEEEEEERPAAEWNGSRLAEECLLAACAMLLLLLVTAPFATTSLREVAASSLFRGLVVRDLVLDSSLATGVLLSGLHLLAHLTPTTLALVGGAAFLSAHHGFQPPYGYGIAHSVSPAAVLVGLLALACLALLSHDTIRHDTETAAVAAAAAAAADKTQHKRRLAACLATIALLLSANYTRCIVLLARPHDPLPAIQGAQNAANEWIDNAAKSRTARDAAAAYKARYAMPPPPQFDKWLAFARKHNSPVIDAFDQIHDDLLPFWGLSPAELRARTSHLLSLQQQAGTSMGVGGLRIRGGHVTLLNAETATPGTHAWMMDAYRDMVAPFAASLPDMDVAFNLDDECRVAMPADVLGQLLGEARRPVHVLASSKANGHPLRGWFSKAADRTWDAAYREAEEEKERHGSGTLRSKYFSNRKPALPVYDAYIAPTCPADAAGRQYKWWDGSRALPEAQGGIDIIGAVDLCDRPDLAQMHGLLLSPAAFAVTQQALPIFSQSRVAGFNDILVPSPWHFADKVGIDEAADVAWSLKQDTVFWRGSGSDGFAEGNKWPGFLRARLVNLAQQMRHRSGLLFFLLFGSSSSSSNSSGSSSSTTSALPAIDIAFAGNFTHCDPAECRSETATFHAEAAGTPPTIEFQEHWSYRHLLDVDGAAFSGRFLPFVHSQSTAYRATLFRTWYDERVHPWKHYIPLDVGLSGLWDVVWLASRKLIVKQQDSEAPLAEQVAMDGHDWASKALRKEDMQVYMFRLLLEWGRLVDEDREELGYDP